MRTRPLAGGFTQEIAPVLRHRGGRVLSQRTMATTNPHSESRIGVRPRYILLGVDEQDRHHVYRTTDDTVTVIRDGERQFVIELAGDETPDDQMQIVAEHTGWQTRYYGLDAVVERAAAFA